MHFLRTCFAQRWLILGLLLGGVLLWLPTPAGLSVEGQRALSLAAVATLFFATEPIPLPALAFLIAVFQVLLGLGSGNEVARSFMNDAVFFIMGSLMISVALVKQRLDRRIAYALLTLTGANVKRLVFGFTLTSALLASVAGEYTVVALMLPLALAILGHVRQRTQRSDHVAALLLFSIAYGAAVAGIGTPSGDVRNAIMLDYWRQLAGVHVGYVRWMAYAYPLVLVQVPVVVGVLLWTFPPEVKHVRRALVRLRQEVRAQGRLNARDVAVVALFLLTMAGWMGLGQAWGLGVVAVMGAALYLVSGLVRWSDLNSGVNWGVVWLYAAAISLGTQLDHTGAASWLAGRGLALLSVVHLDSGFALLVTLSLLAAGAAQALGAGVTVALLGPVALRLAMLSGGNVLLAGLVTALGSAFAYVGTRAHPSLLPVYSSGYLKASDRFKLGARMTLASLLILWLALALYWPET